MVMVMMRWGGGDGDDEVGWCDGDDEVGWW